VRRRQLVCGALLLVACGACSRSSARHNPIEEPIHEARDGDVDAQFEVGVRVADSPGGTSDFGQAAVWFRRAADSGHPGAQAALGVMLHRGQGIERNDAESIKWLTLAAASDSPDRDAYELWREYVSHRVRPDVVAEGERLARAWTKAP